MGIKLSMTVCRFTELRFCGASLHDDVFFFCYSWSYVQYIQQPHIYLPVFWVVKYVIFKELIYT